MAFRSTLLVLIHVSTWLFEPAIAGSIAAWTTGLGAPQIIMQDDATGRIFYSLCNSNGSTPIFPSNETASFSLDLAPKNGTSLTGVGYAQNGVNIAAMWYQNSNNQIVEALWMCDPTGHFIPASTPNQWIVSSDQPITPNTGLSAVNLGQDSGYRIYFHDNHMATSTLRYTSADGWGVDGNITQDTAVRTLPISAGITDTSRISVVYGRGPSNIEVSTLQRDGTWVVTLFPTPFNEVDRDNDNTTTILPLTNDTAPQDFALNLTANVNWSLEGWNGSARGIGLTFNDDSTRNIFYIGNDSLLHQVSEASGGWQASSGQDIQAWPAADSPNAQFATTFDFNRNQAWIYYISGGNMTQVYQSSKNRWEPASTLRTFNDTVIETDEDNGLSTGAKAGIGVGVGVGGLALLAFVVFFFLRRKRSKEEKKKAESEADAAAGAAGANQPPSSFAGSPAPAYSSGTVQGQWVGGQWVQAQTSGKPDGQWQERYSYAPVADQQPVYHEMPNQEYTHEMLGDTGRRELLTNHNELGENRL
ncbi:hypothetical protein F4818DRAFT_74961 [Hypoxylon cercidicola]|nr:hypothetical protein F4818DRAFT_74961 [Hypoxylon cercidicola]